MLEVVKIYTDKLDSPLIKFILIMVLGSYHTIYVYVYIFMRNNTHLSGEISEIQTLTIV